jgi:hypothetical protein
LLHFAPPSSRTPHICPLLFGAAIVMSAHDCQITSTHASEQGGGGKQVLGWCRLSGCAPFGSTFGSTYVYVRFLVDGEVGARAGAAAQWRGQRRRRRGGGSHLPDLRAYLAVPPEAQDVLAGGEVGRHAEAVIDGDVGDPLARAASLVK